MATLNSIGSNKPIEVAFGGSGANTLTAYGILTGNGTNAITAIDAAAATTGHVLTAVNGTAPTFQAPPSTTFASDAETITGTESAKAVAPSNLKAKLGAQTSHGLPYGAGDSNAIVWTAEPSHGQILIGNTGNVPALGTITAGTNVTVVNAASSITISSTTVGINDQTDSYQLVAGDAGKLITMTKASANTLTVPKDATVNFAVGTQILVYQGGAGVTTIAPEDAGITIRSAGGLLNLYTQYSTCGLVKIAANLWSLAGDLA